MQSVEHFLSEASLLIFDEPTASLDPLAEQRVYDQILDLSRNRMSILISHRLGSVKSSEDIYLLEEGQVKMHGSHEKLMRNSDLYREMYNKQKRVVSGCITVVFLKLQLQQQNSCSSLTRKHILRILLLVFYRQWQSLVALF